MTVSGSAVVAATGDGVASAAALLVSAFFTLNLILFLFNLMPFPPLDGSGAIGLLLPESVALASRKRCDARCWRSAAS